MVRYFPSHTSRLLLQILCFLMSDFSLPLLSPPSAIPLCLSSPISDLHPSAPAFFPSLGHLFSPHPIFSSGRSPSFPSPPSPYHQPSLSTLSSPAAGLFPFLFQPFLPHLPPRHHSLCRRVFGIVVIFSNRCNLNRRAERAQRESPTELSCPLLVGFPKSFPYFHFS